MASFAIIRGTAVDIQNTPIVDGQLLFETDQGNDNKIYGDVGSTRIILGSGGSGASYLNDLRDVDITLLTENQVLQVVNDGGSLKWENTSPLDDWVRDSQGDPIIKILATGTTEISFTQAELSYVVSGGWAVDPYIECQNGYAPPSLKETVWNTTDSTNYFKVSYSKVTSDQAGVGDNLCKLKLRILK